MNAHEPTAPTTDSLRWAVLGAGKIATKFVAALPGSTGTLVAVGSSDPDRAAAFVRDNDCGDVRTGSYQTVLHDPDVDAVYVATVHTTHARIAIDALAAGKHVLCEKPMAPNWGSVMSMVDAAREHDRLLTEAFMYRFHPQTAKLLELVRIGAIGELTHIDAEFSFRTGGRTGRLFDPATAGGGILDVGCYPVSLAQAVAGAAAGRSFAEPSTVTATATIGETGVDEWSVARLGFADGVTASVRTGVRVAGVNTATIYGSGGIIRLDNPWTLSGDPTLTVVVPGEDPVEHTFGSVNSYTAEADGFAAGIAGRDCPQMSGDDSLAIAHTLDRWRAAIGLRYPFETETADIPTVSGKPLQRRSEAPMRYGDIAGLDKRVSRLVLGVDNQPDLAQASAIFDHFFTEGGNTFDTGYIYQGGDLERRLGRWISNRGVRDDVVVITKGAHTPHCDPESITSQLLESLDRIGSDHTDIYMMHRDNPEIGVDEFVDVLDEHAAAGRIAVFGGSNWSPARIDEANAYAAANGKRPFSVLSNHFGLAQAYDVPWKGCLHVTDPDSKRWLRERQIPLLPWSSQARGFFTGRAAPGDESDPELVRCYYSDENFERLRRTRELATELGVQPTAIALAYVLNQPFPTFPLYGPRTIAESRSSMAALGIELTAEQVAWLDLAG